MAYCKNLKFSNQEIFKILINLWIFSIPTMLDCRGIENSIPTVVSYFPSKRNWKFDLTEPQTMTIEKRHHLSFFFKDRRMCEMLKWFSFLNITWLSRLTRIKDSCPFHLRCYVIWILHSRCFQHFNGRIPWDS